MTRSTTRPTTRMAAGLGCQRPARPRNLHRHPRRCRRRGQADASVPLETQEAINQTLGLVNQACTGLSGGLVTVGDAAASTLAAEHAIIHGR